MAKDCVVIYKLQVMHKLTRWGQLYSLQSTTELLRVLNESQPSEFCIRSRILHHHTLKKILT